MKKGTFMNEKEWLDYFETINNRKPTEEEIQQAKANGEFISQEAKNEGVNPQKAQLSNQMAPFHKLLLLRQACLRKLKLLLLL